MIEIRADRDSQPVHPDGPHDHESTRAVASGIDDAVRLLNYATMSRAGLTYPSDVYDVLGALAAAAAKLPQALDQMTAWITAQTDAGQVRENPGYGHHGGDAAAAAADLAAKTSEAAMLANALSGCLAEAQSATSGLEAAE
ncbi:MAG TPA: hypothetical protein VGD91_23595 [Trebonia sp.]